LAQLELARIGFDNVLGYTEADSLKETRQLSQLSVCDLKDALQRGDKERLATVMSWSESGTKFRTSKYSDNTVGPGRLCNWLILF
jgi:hypothetical protein